jgi:hypothetical protein
MLRSSSVRRALTGALSLAVIAGVGAGPLAGSALAAKPKSITDLSISATAPDASGVATPLGAGQSTRARAATFTFATAAAGATYSCSLDGGKAVKCTSPFTYTGLSAANHLVRVTASAPGYRAAKATFGWTVDLTPPAAVSLNPFASPTKASPAITFTGETGASFLCAIDDASAAACTPSDTGTAGVAAEGTHRLTVTPVDAAGNVGPAASAVWVLDLTGPGVVIQDAPPALTNAVAPVVHFAVNGADAATSPITCKLQKASGPPASFTDCSSPFTAVTTSDGAWTLSIRATDLAGNLTTVSTSWTRDATAPGAPVLSGPASPTNAAGGSFTWADVVGADGYLCALDGAAPAACTSGDAAATVAGLPDGSHTFRVTSHDPASNSSVTSTWTWVVDTAAPVLSVTGTPLGATRQTDAAAVVVVDDANPRAASCVLDGPTPSATCGPWSSLADGAYTLTVDALDAAGNAASTEARQWSVDTLAPAVTVTAPASLTAPARVAFSEPVVGHEDGLVGLDVTDSLATVATVDRCTSAGTPVSCTTVHDGMTLTPVKRLVPGQHYTVTVTDGLSADVAGNLSGAAALAFRAQRSLQETTPAAAYNWAVVASKSAIGGKYSTEHLRGARTTWTFSGSSLTWWTRTGRDQGKADVLVDGKLKAHVDNFSRTAKSKVARTYRNLGKGVHTVTIVVTGKKHSARAKGAWVTVDAFSVGTRRTANPVLTSRWGTATKAVVADKANAAVSLTFRGTGITWVTRTARTEGIAKVLVDGKRVATVDNYSSAAKAGVKRVVSGLTDKLHTLKIVVTGKHRAAATGSRVTIDRYVVA